MRCGHSRNNSDYDYYFSRALGRKDKREKKTVVIFIRLESLVKSFFRGRRAVTTRRIPWGRIYVYYTGNYIRCTIYHGPDLPVTCAIFTNEKRLSEYI